MLVLFCATRPDDQVSACVPTGAQPGQMHQGPNSKSQFGNCGIPSKRRHATAHCANNPLQCTRRPVPTHRSRKPMPPFTSPSWPSSPSSWPSLVPLRVPLPPSSPSWLDANATHHLKKSYGFCRWGSLEAYGQIRIHAMHCTHHDTPTTPN